MNDETKEFADEIESLKKRYRSIEAPPYLASRIRAHTQTPITTTRRWRHALAIIPVVILTFGALTLVLQKDTNPIVSPALPSFSALSRLTLDKPASSALGMSRIRTVSTPRMPQKPKTGQSITPEQNFESTEFQKPKENHHDYV